MNTELDAVLELVSMLTPTLIVVAAALLSLF